MSTRLRLRHPLTIQACTETARDFLQLAHTNIIKARRSEARAEVVANYHALAAQCIEKAIIWIKDIAE